MEIVDLAVQSEDIREQAASFLVEHSDEPYSWPSLASGREELARLMVEGFARAILDSEIVAGWVGGLPEYKGARLGTSSDCGTPPISKSRHRPYARQIV